MFSGGASSAVVAEYVIKTYGKENTVLFFTDTYWEDNDNYRFMEEVSEYLGLPITTHVDGRTPE
jgi:3'-phosphoadenosine 5'-phosphosulfate sulfotransferase (PAPS reductase)/FAD synthetase